WAQGSGGRARPSGGEPYHRQRGARDRRKPQAGRRGRAVRRGRGRGDPSGDGHRNGARDRGGTAGGDRRLLDPGRSRGEGHRECRGGDLPAPRRERGRTVPRGRRGDVHRQAEHEEPRGGSRRSLRGSVSPSRAYSPLLSRRGNRWRTTIKKMLTTLTVVLPISAMRMFAGRENFPPTTPCHP